MPPQLHVDIDGLRKTGTDIATPVTCVDDSVERELGRLTVAGPATGWGAAAALAEAAAGWSAHLNGVSQRVRAFGDDLVATADDFRAADLAAAHHNQVPSAGSRPVLSPSPSPQPSPSPSPSPSPQPQPSPSPSPSPQPQPSPSPSPSPQPSPSPSPEPSPSPAVES
ncbi:hypothetical protein [Actinoplanes utahensis]|uniref:hypothetical protein n=1 Tax=Actinoplanes utahensis TaxID=1869 RepID=UPI000ADB1BEB|nr:hypothetical protein [Actinoplanes utahensis]GIF28663.1 hypothetical protein Aut01nite_16490 [Actinoplanes utahensis]